MRSIAWALSSKNFVHGLGLSDKKMSYTLSNNRSKAVNPSVTNDEQMLAGSLYEMGWRICVLHNRPTVEGVHIQIDSREGPWANEEEMAYRGNVYTERSTVTPIERRKAMSDFTMFPQATAFNAGSTALHTTSPEQRPIAAKITFKPVSTTIQRTSKRSPYFPV